VARLELEPPVKCLGGESLERPGHRWSRPHTGVIGGDAAIVRDAGSVIEQPGGS
jgi:hypothetical protein